MTDETWLDPTKGPSAKEVAFDYIKTPDFRAVWADGVIGSLTPNGLIHFVVYAERPAIPRRQVYSIEDLPDGTQRLGEEQIKKQISRGSVVREMACDIFMAAEPAEDLAKWLLEQVEEIKKIQEEAKK